MQEDDFSPVVLGDQPEETDLPEQEEPELLEELETETTETEPEEKPEKKPERPKMARGLKRKIAIALAGAAGLVAVVYLGGAIYYSGHFFNGTTINGFDCSNMNVEQAKPVSYTHLAIRRWSFTSFTTWDWATR